MTEETKVEKVKTKTFTYIGGGEDSPNIIQVMGKIEMVRGMPVEIPVTAEYSKILSKISGCSTIVEGKIELKDLTVKDVEAKNKADKRRAEDKIINQQAMKMLGKDKK